MKGCENVKKMKNSQDDASMPSCDRYLLRLKAYGDYYTLLICFVAACAVAAAGIALFSSVLIGLALAVSCAVVYSVCRKSEAKKQLGLYIEHIRGSVHVEKAVAAYGNELIIPDRIELARVTHICDGAFDDTANSELKIIYLPDGICYIGRDIFGNNIPNEIRFAGTSDAWSAIEKHTDTENITVTFDAELPTLPKKSFRLRKEGKK